MIFWFQQFRTDQDILVFSDGTNTLMNGDSVAYEESCNTTYQGIDNTDLVSKKFVISTVSLVSMTIRFAAWPMFSMISALCEGLSWDTSTVQAGSA